MVGSKQNNSSDKCTFFSIHIITWGVGRKTGEKEEECALTGDIHQAAYQYSVTPNNLRQGKYHSNIISDYILFG